MREAELLLLANNALCISLDVTCVMHGHLHERVGGHKRKATSIYKHYKIEHNTLASKNLISQFYMLAKCKSKFNCLLKEMLFIRRLVPDLKVQTNSFRAKVFVWCLMLIFQLFSTLNRSSRNENNYFSFDNGIMTTSKRRGFLSLSLIFKDKFKTHFHVYMYFHSSGNFPSVLDSNREKRVFKSCQPNLGLWSLITCRSLTMHWHHQCFYCFNRSQRRPVTAAIVSLLLYNNW